MEDGMKALAAALCKAQAVMGAALKDAENPHFKSRYADLASVWEAIRKPLTDNGLCVMQTVEKHAEDGLLLRTTLMHTGGGAVSSLTPILMAQQTPQAMGSAITYARRYSLAAMVGVVQDDDDGEAAQGRPVFTKPAPSPAPSPAPAAPKPAAPGAPSIEFGEPMGLEAFEAQLAKAKTKAAVENEWKAFRGGNAGKPDALNAGLALRLKALHALEVK